MECKAITEFKKYKVMLESMFNTLGAIKKHCDGFDCANHQCPYATKDNQCGMKKFIQLCNTTPDKWDIDEAYNIWE